MMSKSASQREADEFHMMLGYCIAAWADVDDLLFRIFRVMHWPSSSVRDHLL